MGEKERPERSVPRLTRRAFVAVMGFFSFVLALLPFSSIIDFVSSKTELNKPRKKIANIRDFEGLDPPALQFSYPEPVDPEKFPKHWLLSFLIKLPGDPKSIESYRVHNAVCTHLRCIVKGYFPEFTVPAAVPGLPDKEFEHVIPCPCHGSVFDAFTGDVVDGPAPLPLPRVVLEMDEKGDIYAVDMEGQIGVGRTE